MNRNEIFVKLDFRNGKSFNLGTLLISDYENGILFEYERSFLNTAIEIAPFTLPLQVGTFKAGYDPDLYNLHHVFADALPDDWGRKIQDEEFDKIGLHNPTPLDRLAFLGKFGLGALTFEPSREFPKGNAIIKLAQLRKYAQSVIAGNIENVPDELLQNGGSAGGARPKFLVDFEPQTENMRYTRGAYNDSYRPVLLKFPIKDSIGLHQRIEYCYGEMARKANINMPKTYLLEKDEDGKAAFAIERFDVKPFGERLHMHTLAGMLGRNFRRDQVDYSDIILVLDRIKAPRKDFTEVYKRLVFNHIAGNKDDHSKNFSFLMNSDGKWKLSPFYDMGYSKGIAHQMSLNGKFTSVNFYDLKRFAEEYSIDNYIDIIEQVIHGVAGWYSLAIENGVPEKSIRVIKNEIDDTIKRIEKDMYRRIPGKSKKPEWFKYTFKGGSRALLCYGLKHEPEKSISVTEKEHGFFLWKKIDGKNNFIKIKEVISSDFVKMKKMVEEYYRKL